MRGGGLITTVYPVPANTLFSIQNETIKNEVSNVTYSYVIVDNDFTISEREDNPYNLCYYNIVLLDKRNNKFKLIDSELFNSLTDTWPITVIDVRIDNPHHQQVSTYIDNICYIFENNCNFGDFYDPDYRLVTTNYKAKNLTVDDIICNENIISFNKTTYHGYNNQKELLGYLYSCKESYVTNEVSICSYYIDDLYNPAYNLPETFQNYNFHWCELNDDYPSEYIYDYLYNECYVPIKLHNRMTNIYPTNKDIKFVSIPRREDDIYKLLDTTYTKLDKQFIDAINNPHRYIKRGNIPYYKNILLSAFDIYNIERRSKYFHGDIGCIYRCFSLNIENCNCIDKNGTKRNVTLHPKGNTNDTIGLDDSYHFVVFDIKLKDNIGINILFNDLFFKFTDSNTTTKVLGKIFIKQDKFDINTFNNFMSSFNEKTNDRIKIYLNKEIKQLFIDNESEIFGNCIKAEFIEVTEEEFDNLDIYLEAKSL